MRILLLATALASTVRAEEEGGEDSLWPMVGIDLGTTFSAVGIWRDGQVEIIPNDMGNRITPSMVAFNNEERLIGDAALNQISANPENTVYAIKRLIGRKFNDLEVQRDVTSLSFTVKSDKSKEDKPVVQVSYQGEKKVFTPEEISAMILHKMKETAQAFVGQDITNAVVTVPAYFNDAQRQSTKDAGKIAGLNVRRIINEPTAAAIAYGLNKKGENKILVYDFGGGTFDVSLLTIDDGFFEVVATNGNTHLGGEDMDNRLVKHFSAMMRKKEKIDISADKKALARLRRSCEAAKRQLSSSPEARVEVDGIAPGYDLSEKLTRAKFEELVMDLLQGTLDPVKAVLKDADWEPKDVDEIVLVGGSSRIPKVQELIEKLFGGKKPHKGINPDEAVAHGAAVQAAVLAGAQGMDDRVLLVDVCPLSLGIETVGGVMSKIITRNTQIPARGTKVVSTNSDNQDKLKIQVFEGERPFTKNNRPLGTFELRGIPPAPRNVPKIEVAFELDENGILSCTAHDKKSGIKEQITISNDKGTLTDEEIQRMLTEAERFAEADKNAAEATALRNDLEAWMYRIRNQFDEEEHLINKLEAEPAEQISNAQRECIEWLESHPAATKDELMEKYKEMEGIVKPIMEALYKEHELKAPGSEDGEVAEDSEEEEGDPTEL